MRASSGDGVGLVRARLAALLAADVDALPVAECGAQALELLRLASALEAAAAARLARFDAHAGYEAECAATATGWLRRELRLDPAEAPGRGAAARVLRDPPATA